MTTTAVLFELIVIGFMAFSWMALLASRILGITLEQFKSFLAVSQEWAWAIVSIVIVFAYPIGWMMNHLGYLILTKPRIVSEFETKKGTVKVREAEALIWFYAPETAIRDARFDISIFRLLRASVINYLMLGIVIAIYGVWYLIPSAFLFLLSLASYFVYKQRIKRYFERVEYMYKVARKASKKTKK